MFFKREQLWSEIIDLNESPKRIIELGVAWGYTTNWFLKKSGQTRDTLKISFTSIDGIPGNAITFWENSTNPYPNGEARLGNQELGDLCFTLYYEKF